MTSQGYDFSKGSEPLGSRRSIDNDIFSDTVFQTQGGSSKWENPVTDLPYRITQCYLPPTQVNTPCLNPSQRPVLDLPTPEGWKAELTEITLYMPRWFTCT